VECPICGEYRSALHKLCPDCTATYGDDSETWPYWAKELRRMQRAFERNPGGVTGRGEQRIEIVRLGSG